MHVFQEQLILGQKSGDLDSEKQNSMEALVDLQHTAIFEEQFYLVVIEKQHSTGQSVLHMWKLIISSQGKNCFFFYYSKCMVFLKFGSERNFFLFFIIKFTELQYLILHFLKMNFYHCRVPVFCFW